MKNSGGFIDSSSGSGSSGGGFFFFFGDLSPLLGLPALLGLALLYNHLTLNSDRLEKNIGRKFYEVTRKLTLEIVISL